MAKAAPERPQLNLSQSVNALNTVGSVLDIVTGKVVSQTREGVQELINRRGATRYVREVVPEYGATEQDHQTDMEAERIVQRSFLIVARELDIANERSLNPDRPILNTTRPDNVPTSTTPSKFDYLKRMSERELIDHEHEVATHMKATLGKKDKKGVTAEETLYEIADAGTYNQKITGGIEEGSPSRSRATIVENVNSIPLADPTMSDIRFSNEVLRAVREEIDARLNLVGNGYEQPRKEVIYNLVKDRLQGEARASVETVANMIEAEYTHNNLAKIRGNKVDRQRTIKNGILYEIGYSIVYLPIIPAGLVLLAKNVPWLKDVAGAGIDFLQSHGFSDIPDLADIPVPQLFWGAAGQSVLHAVLSAVRPAVVVGSLATLAFRTGAKFFADKRQEEILLNENDMRQEKTSRRMNVVFAA